MKSSQAPSRLVGPTLLLGLVLGAACSDQITAAADAAADAVGEALRAAGVLYDNTTSGLAATDVQAAIDELVERSDVLESGIAAQVVRIDALETRSGRQQRLEGTLTTLEGSVDALDQRVQAVETTVEGLDLTDPTAADVAYDPPEGVEASSVKAALDALHGRVVALEEEKEALKAELAALKTCPEGFETINGGCIESEPRLLEDYTYAHLKCRLDGYRLCRFDDYAAACSSGKVYVDEESPEWTAELVGDATAMLVSNKLNNCYLYPGYTSEITSQIAHPFRCCRDR